MILGFDEVGRGCLAGPVVAACSSLPEGVEGLTDSKKLTEKKRSELYPKILNSAQVKGIGWCTSQEIDQWNIRVASLLAMLRALVNAAGLSQEACTRVLPVRWDQQDLLIRERVRDFFSSSDWLFQFDGRETLKDWLWPEAHQEAVIKGDLKVKEISAASIVAKVFRDEWMGFFDHSAPVYGLRQHKGYPSMAHKTAIAHYGPSYFHRRSFRSSLARQE